MNAESAREFPVRAVDVLFGGAADVRPQRHAAERLQPMGEGTGRNTVSTVFPTDESMDGALTRVVQPPRSVVAGNARHVHRDDMPNDFV
jgi:hypothetical protein